MLNTTTTEDALLFHLWRNPRGVRRFADMALQNAAANLSRKGLVSRSLPTGHYHLTDRNRVAKHLRRIGCALEVAPVAVESRRAA